jgi:hypothetical protein
MPDKVELAEVKRVLFEFEDSTISNVFWNGYGWEQYGTRIIEPDVLDVVFDSLNRHHYLGKSK